MYRYTTPTLPLTIDDESLDFADVANFRVAIEQGNVKMLKIVEATSAFVNPETKTIYVPLTQEETALLKEGLAEAQVRIVFASGAVQATNKGPVPVHDVLDEVIV
jgi:hypothetical protein